MSLVDKFMQFKCAGDVLSSVYPIKNPEKEISESMSIFPFIRKVLLNNPNKYTLFDLCAGNALTSSLISHLFKLKKSFAIDNRERERDNFNKINNFEYLNLDIKKQKEEVIILIKSWRPSIIVSVHPCGNLALDVLEIFQRSADYLFLIPCCEEKPEVKYPNFIKDKLTSYELWCLNLCQLSNGNGFVSKRCLSPKNIVITATNNF